jgi:hypothetical protein
MAALATGQAPSFRIGAEQRQFLGDADTKDLLIIGKDVLDLIETGAEDEMREIRLIHRFHVETVDQLGIADGAEMQAGGAQILQPILRPVEQPLVRQFARCQQVVIQIGPDPDLVQQPANRCAAPCLIGQQADLLAL